jgi:hypothetical protein
MPNTQLEPIDLHIQEELDEKFITKVKAFNLSFDEERKNYEFLLNSRKIVILEEYGPAYNKAGHAIFTVRWKEPVDSPSRI